MVIPLAKDSVDEMVDGQLVAEGVARSCVHFSSHSPTYFRVEYNSSRATDAQCAVKSQEQSH